MLDVQKMKQIWLGRPFRQGDEGNVYVNMHMNCGKARNYWKGYNSREFGVVWVAVQGS